MGMRPVQRLITESRRCVTLNKCYTDCYPLVLTHICLQIAAVAAEAAEIRRIIRTQLIRRQAFLKDYSNRMRIELLRQQAEALRMQAEIALNDVRLAKIDAQLRDTKE
jgi:hypothetical protein